MASFLFVKHIYYTSSGSSILGRVGKISKTSLENFNYQNFKIWSRFHFTREIELNDEYLSQFCPDRKVLWMTLEQLFKIFMKFTVIDCIRAIFIYVHGSSSTLFPF